MEPTEEVSRRFQPAPRLKKPVRPDHKELRSQAEKFTLEINRYADRIKEIKATLDNRRKQPRAGSKQDAVVRNLNEHRAELQKLLKQRQAIRDEISRVDASRDALRGQAKTLKEKYPLKVEDIDAQISKLENKINHTTLSAKEEVDVINQIKQLAKSRETVRSQRSQLDKMQNNDQVAKELFGKLRTLDEELDKLRGEEKKAMNELSGLKAESAGANEDYEALIVEKQTCWDVMTALKDKRKEIEDEFSAKMDAFRKEEAEFREKLAEERKKRDEARSADAERVKAERQIKKSEYEVLQRDAKKETDLLMCDQLLAYLRKFVQEKAQDQKENASEDYFAPAEGMKLVKRDDPAEESESSWMFKGKSTGKKSNRGKKPKVPSEKPGDKKLNHTFDTMAAFHTLKVTVPNCVSEVPNAIEAVKESRLKIEQGNYAKPSTSSNANGNPTAGDALDNKESNNVSDEPATNEDNNLGGSSKADQTDVPSSSPDQLTATEPNIKEPYEGKEDFPPLSGEAEGLGVGA